jgi:methionyl-tRNA formyltransferase
MVKTIFLGTPALAVPFLERLHQKTEVTAVITSPDQPSGRGDALKAPEVKIAAQLRSLLVLQPETLSDKAVVDQVRALGAEVGIVVAYGKLLPKKMLEIPKHGFLNVHFSLLPKYRGAAPIQWTLLNGETETGVTLFWLDEGMDTGPIFIQKTMAILAQDDADTLRNKLVELGVEALDEALDQLTAGHVVRQAQKGTASRAPMLKKEDGAIDWSKPAEILQNRVRGFTPWPGVYSGNLKMLKVKLAFDTENAVPGTVIRLVTGEGPVIKCGQNSLVLLHVQPEGKKAMPAWSWWQGSRLKIGDKIG